MNVRLVTVAIDWCKTSVVLLQIYNSTDAGRPEQMSIVILVRCCAELEVLGVGTFAYGAI